MTTDDRYLPPLHPMTHRASTIAGAALDLAFRSMFVSFLVLTIAMAAVLYPTCLVIGWAAGRACEGWRFLRGDRDDRSCGRCTPEDVSCR